MPQVSAASEPLGEAGRELLEIDPLSAPSWNELLVRSPESMIFHEPAWMRLIARHFGVPIWAWALADDAGSLAAAVPVAGIRSPFGGRRAVSLPFSDACQPLSSPAAVLGTGELAAALARACTRSGQALEVRGTLERAPGATVVERYVQHRLTLDPDLERVVAGFTRSQVMRGVAKARREGVTIERHLDRDGLERFYRLHVRTRRRQGVPTQPRAFILAFDELFDQGYGFVLLARHRGSDIAAAVFLTANGVLTYKYGASDRRRLSVRPNNLLFLEAIRWGCEHDQRVLDFGRTDHEHLGLRAFKASWGAVESPLAYTYFGAFDWRATRGLTSRLLSASIRHGPPGVGRLAGAALYRYFG